MHWNGLDSSLYDNVAPISNTVIPMDDAQRSRFTVDAIYRLFCYGRLRRI